MGALRSPGIYDKQKCALKVHVTHGDVCYADVFGYSPKALFPGKTTRAY